MRLIDRILYYWIFILSSCTFGLEIIPDSISKSIAPLTTYHLPLQTIKLKNQSNAIVIIDSILIRFQNGDSSDLKMGFNCNPPEFYDYNYKGWVYGSLNKTLRYLRDSLFLLQDSTGNISTIAIAPYDSSDLDVYLIVNCPICGRMPSFPKTTRYLYLFYSAPGKYDSLKVHIDDVTFIKPKRMRNEQQLRGTVRTELYDLRGRLLNTARNSPYGIVIVKSINTDNQEYRISQRQIDINRKEYAP